MFYIEVTSSSKLMSSLSISLSVGRSKVSGCCGLTCSTVGVLGLLGSVLLSEFFGSSLGLVGPKNGTRAAFMVCFWSDGGCLSPWLCGSRLVWMRAEVYLGKLGGFLGSLACFSC